ncbi:MULTISPECIES: copper homeostasis membrane protein CopD [unclassified Sphingomonas]|jgi:putative copper resistance protein D|uniref:copper homeostasis membrane protein CopD n=1 Tax=unclassified Sphingomonas TaxID=196159 RepID=UPI00285E6BDD|nr:copper homeostasis membrane protein CopD [Sphingomonas sp. BE123]MDR6851739.1 putative copper resistance protein D [Sphingomonas sp. BE123]
MSDWVAIGLRFAAYADLMLLAGLAMGGGLGRHAPAIGGRVIGWLAILGVVITIAQLAATSLAMTGYDLAILDREMLTFMAFETSMGISHIVRAAALALLAALQLAGRASRSVAAALAIVALGSLAWTGHAGASEAALGWAHRSSDIVHLVAGALWIAALAMFVRLLLLDFATPGAARTALAALARFSGIGGIIVAAIVVSGAINLVAIVGIEGLSTTFGTSYGQLLVLKLILFGVMLALAGFNRWRLVPTLEMALGGDRQAIAQHRLRLAILVETVAAVLILAVVAILGTLSPVD